MIKNDNYDSDTDILCNLNYIYLSRVNDPLLNYLIFTFAVGANNYSWIDIHI